VGDFEVMNSILELALKVLSFGKGVNVGGPSINVNQFSVPPMALMLSDQLQNVRAAWPT